MMQPLTAVACMHVPCGEAKGHAAAPQPLHILIDIHIPLTAHCFPALSALRKRALSMYGIHTSTG